ncbi:arginyl-tRNA--protein transferase 1 isoform X1 [Drosophila simulans]|uniref:Arginyl-tRNA--protein transferase 1 n=1 Tax=Drosophila simulans TaxID=7240 RepID=A0A0J9RH36_DROSI|nr:arginyl-tRNA--protein transferase 1 isoform X1 [Drosophila simulans]KMY95226.1 Ate1, isoform B [Drosophila simulans]
MSGSIVQYYGSQQSKCGYCAGANCSLSHGMHAYRLDCKDYQDLIDRGWRRCGNYCYKLRNQETCCPCYTIKCNGLEFKLSKSNKRILRRINRFLRDGRRDSKPEAGEGDGEADADDAIGAPEVTASEPQPQLPDKSPTVINVDHVASLATAQKKPTKQATAPAVEAPTLGSNKSAAPISNKPCKKAKQMRLDRRRAKLGDSASISTKSVSQEKTLRDFLNTDSETNKHRLKIVLVASSDTEHTCADAVIALYRKYQITVHNDNPARLTLASMQRFLVKSPLKNEKPRDGPEMGYGSFHQQYWLDDKLIAVGVIDILPGCVSSVYFFYDPDYSFLSLGTYGSLREIELVQSLAENVPSLKYYYMGFYIHSCPKMRYKGKLSPSYLLCPETYEWLPLTDVIRAKLDEHKYQRLNEDPAARDVNEFLKEHLDEVMMLLDAKTCTNYRHYRQLRGAVCDVDTIIEYGKLVGKACACRMLYVK